MKCLLSLTLFLLLQMTIIAQDQYPLVKEGVIWTNYYTADFPENAKHYHYAILGDTMIEAVTYKKVFESTEAVFSITSPNNIYKGAIREIDKRVLYIEKETVQMDTLYDFNLQIGDTFYQLEEVDIMAYLKRIDTIQLEDAVPRKKFIFHKSSADFISAEAYSFSWIDGIGSTEGFFGFPDCDLISWIPVDPQCSKELLCYQSEDGNLIYTDSTYYEGDCAVITTTEDIEMLEDYWLVFPNPAKAQVNFQFRGIADMTTASLQVTDINGRLIETIRIPSGHRNITWSIPSDLSGVYLYRFIVDDKLQQTHKLIIIQ